MPGFSASVESDIRSIVGDRCSFDPEIRKSYRSDRCWYAVTPIGIVWPRETSDVSRVVRYCHERTIPVIPRGAATGLAGQAVGMGLILDFTKYMTSISDITESNVTVQPGIVLQSLNDELRRSGRFFPVDPASASLCTIGGMIATNAAGSHGVRYGAMKDHVLSLTVVLSNGETAVISDPGQTVDASVNPLLASATSTLSPLLMENKELIRKAFPAVAKNSSGYNLKDAVASNKVDYRKLIVGSEGTLALLVEAKLATVPLVPVRLGALLYLRSYESAVEATLGALELGPSAIELIDRTYTALAAGIDPAVDRLLSLNAPVLLYVEFEGSDPADLQRSVVRLGTEASLLPALRFLPLTDPSEQAAFWRLREEASKVINSDQKHRKTSFIEDVCVPVKRLPAYIKGLRAILERNGIRFSLYGHAASGNIHCATFVDLTDLHQYRLVDTVATEVYDLAIELGGTLSGEHGDGFVRTPFLERLYGTDVFALFRTVKEIFDPQFILNPGKIIGDQHTTILHDLDLS